MTDARIEGVRIAWDDDERVLKFTSADPRGQLLVKDCHFGDVGDVPFAVWFGDCGEARFGGEEGER